MKRIGIQLCILLFVFGLVPLSSVRAQSPVEVRENVVEHSFGQEITFRLGLEADSNVTEINLILNVVGDTDILALSMDVGETDDRIELEYSLDPVSQGIPAFAQIDYHWEVHSDAWPLPEEIPGSPFVYSDNRYPWHYLSSGPFTVYWIDGDLRFGETALNVANQALPAINRELTAPVPDNINIYIYPSEADARSAMELSGREWAGGQARPELGVILIGIPNDGEAVGAMQRAIPHELTHLLVYERIGRLSGRVPPWLNEGLATANELTPSSYYQVILDRAFEQDRLIPLEALCAPFSSDQDTALLSYAQSGSLVRYLRDQKGSGVIRELLAAYADGASCEGGVVRVLGTGLKGLDSAWRAHVRRQGQWWLILRDNAIWLALWLLTGLLVLPFLGTLRQKPPPALMEGAEQ